MSSIKLKCKNCNVDFDYPKKEYTRQSKLKRQHFFCSRGCGTTYNNKNRPNHIQEKISKALSERSKENSYSKKGEFTYILHSIKKRKNFYDIDEEYLQQIWKIQDGKCAISGMKLINPKYNQKNKKPNMASLDRIDSSIGYVKGNVQFLAYSINLAKNDFDQEEFKSFILEMKAT